MAELDVKLDQLAKNNPTTMIKFIAIIAKWSQYLITFGGIMSSFKNIDHSEHKLFSLRNMLTTFGITTATSLLYRYGNRLLLHLLNKYLHKLLNTNKNLSDEDINNIKSILKYTENLITKISDSALKTAYKSALSGLLATPVILGIHGASTAYGHYMTNKMQDLSNQIFINNDFGVPPDNWI